MSDFTSWPFYPEALSDVLDPETLAKIETGSCERLKRALTILDTDKKTRKITRRIESIEEKRNFQPFCQKLRERDAGEAACLARDLWQAQKSLDEYLKTGNPYLAFPCHMGLIDQTYIIRIRNRPIAMVISGQFCDPRGSDSIETAIEMAGTPGGPVIPLEQSDREILRELAKKITPFPPGARKALETEALYIQNIAEDAFESYQRQKQDEYLDQLRQAAINPEAEGRQKLAKQMKSLLKSMRSFLGCTYLVFFAAIQDGDTVLSPFISDGIPEKIEASLPHFNWRKAGLPLENFEPGSSNLLEWQADARSKGIRGDNQTFFSKAALIIPTSLGDHYRGVLVFGPLAQEVLLEKELRFLIDMANLIGHSILRGLEVINLVQERKHWHNTARLLTHQVKTALTPITTRIGQARDEVQHPKGGIDAKKLDAYLKQAEDLSMLLSHSAKETLNGHVLLTMPEDLDREDYPLSVLIENCATGFLNQARESGKDIILDPSIEALPEARVDIARMTVALANLIDNAIKYSFYDTRIYIRARLNLLSGLEHATATIEVDDIGQEISSADKERIFDPGTRGTNVLMISRIPGSGLGLWEASSIARAHGGSIQVSSEPTAIYRREGKGHRVVFSLTIPIAGN